MHLKQNAQAYPVQKYDCLGRASYTSRGTDFGADYAGIFYAKSLDSTDYINNKSVKSAPESSRTRFKKQCVGVQAFHFLIIEYSLQVVFFFFVC